MSLGQTFLELLSEEDSRALDALGTVRRVRNGEVVLSQGQVADRVVVLRAGHVKVVAPTPARGDVVLAFRGPGSLLGEQSLLDGSPRGASVIAVGEGEVLVVAASAFRAYLERRPGVALSMLAQLSERLRDADRRLAEFAAADTLGRVAGRLAELAENHGETCTDGTIRIALGLTQEDLAGWTGASIEGVGRALRTLRQLGWLTTGRREIVVLDLDALRSRAA